MNFFMIIGIIVLMIIIGIATMSDIKYSKRINNVKKNVGKKINYD